MKYCLCVPRVLLPRGDFAAYAVPSYDGSRQVSEYRERVAYTAGNAPSALRFLLTEDLPDIDEDSQIKSIRENMYRFYECDGLEKLARGSVFVERTTSSGVRRGLLFAVDLEAYTYTSGEISPVRPAEAVQTKLLENAVKARANSLFEIPAVVILYRDKKDRAMRLLREEAEAQTFEPLYDFGLLKTSGRIKGTFIPNAVSEDIATLLHGRDQTPFIVVEGIKEITAAKLHWEQLKKTLPSSARISHPARFLLAEFRNIYDESVVLRPIHRVLKGVDPETAIDYFTSRIRCKQDGLVISPALIGGVGIGRIEDLIKGFIRANGGQLVPARSMEELSSLVAQGSAVGLVMKAPDKDDLFEAIGEGALCPENTFTLGDGMESRFHLEGREIGYD